MKKTINGKIYDTDTATVVAQRDNGRVLEGLYYIQETLYRTPDGDFFLFGEGGAGTAYSRTLPDGWTAGGEDIIPMKPEEAQAWGKK